MASAPRRVLFVCIGNSCRSQMAEGFARHYGRDVMVVQSAGLAPATLISRLTHDVMLEKNIRLAQHHPKPLNAFRNSEFDLVVNISGAELPSWTRWKVVEWNVQDPIGEPVEVYRTVRDQIENQVMQLILSMRSPARARAHTTRRQSR